jgi:AbrB family transcriptional regulator, transcriptional pleiotropic regulator of transition state genes
VSEPQVTGIGRKVDELGRIVLPVELRRAFDIREGDLLDGEHITLTKRRAACALCGNTTDLRSFRDRRICNPCLVELQRL